MTTMSKELKRAALLVADDVYDKATLVRVLNLAAEEIEEIKERAIKHLQSAYKEGFTNGFAMSEGDDTVGDIDGGTELSLVLIQDIMN